METLSCLCGNILVGWPISFKHIQSQEPSHYVQRRPRFGTSGGRPLNNKMKIKHFQRIKAPFLLRHLFQNGSILPVVEYMARPSLEGPKKLAATETVWHEVGGNDSNLSWSQIFILKLKNRDIWFIKSEQVSIQETEKIKELRKREEKDQWNHC